MASSPGTVTADDLTEEQRGEHLNRLLYRVINEVEQRILMLPSTSGSLAEGHKNEIGIGA